MTTHHSTLLNNYLSELENLNATSVQPILDLACGSGRNGLYLVDNNIPVTFADIKPEALGQVQQSLSYLEPRKQQLANCWQVDFEQGQLASLAGKSFAAIMVFRYLHRPLFEQLKAAVKPGGIVIYETFTEQQAQFGRPKNPDFLLKAGELREVFSGWKIIHSFEGVIPSANTEGKQAIAQIVAVKPEK